MSAFSETLRRLRSDRGLSLAALGKAVSYSGGYIWDLERGRRRPHPELAAALDVALHAGGALVAAYEQPVPGVLTGDHPLTADDAVQLHATIDHLVSLDTAHGSAGLDGIAARAFRQAQQRAATTGVAPAAAADVHAAVAELGEVAAWIAYDAEEQASSRELATEALLLARLAGDKHLERFILSHVAMQSVYTGRFGEALAIADRVLAEEPVSRRVEGMFRLRRARALGGLGAGTEALAEMATARALLAEGRATDDPDWTWWLHDAELAVHEARLRAALGDQRGAAEWSQRAVEVLPARQGRDGALYRAWLLRDLVAARAWRPAEQVAAELVDRAGAAVSARVPNILRATLEAVRRPEVRAPRWVRDAVQDASDATTTE